MKLSTIENDNFHVNIFDGDLPGSTLCIVGGVHGNEICGVEAIKRIKSLFLKDLIFFKGRLVTIVANYQAVKQKKRFINWDLNRAFGETEAFGHEQYVAKQLTPYLRDVDYLIDLHSTSAPTKPFCAGNLTPKHLKLLTMTGISLYTHGWETHRKYTMLVDEVSRWGGVGLIAECGKHDELNTNQIAYSVALKVLGNLEVKLKNLEIQKLTTETSLNSTTIVEVKKIIKPRTNNFSFVQKFHNFDSITPNQVVAYDGRIPISFPYSYLMLLPIHRKLRQGEEAFGIGTLSKI